MNEIDEIAIARLVAEYCQLLDDGRFDEVIERFTDDGTFCFAGREVVGRPALLAYYDESQSADRRGKHLVTNLIIDVEGDRATVRSDFAFLARVDGVMIVRVVGRYDDEIHRIDGTWRFHRRDVRVQ
jgi:3-phenylpropionate/cinnamic acid dioxygenase small subunit